MPVQLLVLTAAAQWRKKILRGISHIYMCSYWHTPQEETATTAYMYVLIVTPKKQEDTMIPQSTIAPTWIVSPPGSTVISILATLSPRHNRTVAADRHSVFMMPSAKPQARRGYGEGRLENETDG